MFDSVHCKQRHTLMINRLSPLASPPVRGRMVSSRKVLQTALLVLRVLLVLVLLGVPPAADSAANKVTICIKNCAQCKLMYHDHFKGGLCAEFCLQVEGRFIPDCANPQDLIPFFLERLE